MKQALKILSIMATTLTLFNIIFPNNIPIIQAATAWSAGTPEIISDNSELGFGFEPSGIVYQPEREQLVLIGDDGDITLLSPTGTVIDTWNIGLDLEGVTIADTSSNLVYLANENPDTIIEFDITSGAVTGNEWDLTEWMTSSNDNNGLEALTFVPNAYHNYSASAAGGLFYAGLQSSGEIYIFDVDLSTSGAVTQVDTWTSESFVTDIAGLHFEASTERLFALYDASNIVREYTTSGIIETEYQNLPGTGQEAITLISNCPAVATAAVYIGDDSDVTVTKFPSLGITCVVEDDENDDSNDDSGVIAKPDKPTSLKVKKQERRKVKIIWNGSADKYKLQLRKRNGTLVKRLHTVNNNKVITKSNLRKNKRYMVRVKGCNDAGCSKFTAYKKFNTF